jgi:hypothetical protein
LQLSSWIMACILSLILLASACCRVSNRAYRTIGTLWLLTCCPAAGLLFLIFKSDMCTDNPVMRELIYQNSTSALDSFEHSCKLGRGSLPYIIGVAGFFLTGAATICLSFRNTEPKTDDNKSVYDEQSTVKESPGVSVYVMQHSPSQTDQPSFNSPGSTSGSVSDYSDKFDPEKDSPPPKSALDTTHDDNPFASDK